MEGVQALGRKERIKGGRGWDSVFSSLFAACSASARIRFEDADRVTSDELPASSGRPDIWERGPSTETYTCFILDMSRVSKGGGVKGHLM